MNYQKQLNKAVAKLADMQVKHLFQMPQRENIPEFDPKLDLGQNKDFALWEMEINPEFGRW